MDQGKDAAVPHGRKLRRNRKSLKDMYTALGIEASDDSDEEYELEDEKEAEDDDSDDRSDLSEDAARNIGRKPLQRNKQDGNTSGGKSNKRSASTIHLNRYSPHDTLRASPKKQRTLKKLVKSDMIVADRGGGTGGDADAVDGNPHATKFAGAAPTSRLGEYKPRDRSSKHLEEMASMHAAVDNIVNVVPAFGSSVTFSSWDDFDEALGKYQVKNKLNFRVRSSQRTVLYNSTHPDDQMPAEFEWTQKFLRCTHGVSQASRSKGHRNRQPRYCKCTARLTAFVKMCADYTYKIAIKNENHTHSHPTTMTQASSYLTTKTLPLDDEDREDVKTLADARVSSSHITNFLNERLVCKLTSQQTRNLIRSIMGQDTAEDMLKNVLHALRQLDGSDVLVLQDNRDVTCGVVMQTKVQKMMFERWGENLTMDFTHGTNNLGYHLGSLVVTTCTGRGFPVVDFMCMNEYAGTIKTILEYFKSKNPKWESVQTVVIDKDFVEWKVLEEVFPSARVLLCQFHAISYWKKVMKRPVFKCKVTESEELLKLMMTLLYCRTKDEYRDGYKALKRYCETRKKVGFFAYFDKNWHSCRGMWSNYSRGKHFTAGNTTTNRIESNWKYLKLLLGKRTQIDQTITALLQHQMTITRQVVSEIEKQHASSRVAYTVPTFLRAVAGRLSSHVFDKVKKQWERFVNRMEITTCSWQPVISAWEVSTRHQRQVFECDGVNWTCTCLFYTSHHLPCSHLMHMASEGLNYDRLPGSSIPDRWSTFEALDVADDFSREASALRRIVNMSKLKLPKTKIRLPDDCGEKLRDPSTRSSSKPREDEKQVAYIRLRRNERAKEVVLTSAQKYTYAKAMVEPLLQHLSELSSAKFYDELNAWKETVESGLSTVTPHSTVSDSRLQRPDDYDEVDMGSLLDPDDAIETAHLIEQFENSDASTPATSDDDNVPPTQVSETGSGSVGIKPKDVASAPSLKPVLVEAKRPPFVPASATDTVDEPAPRQVDVINVPKPKRRGRARTTTKQLRQTKLEPRLAVHQYPSDLTVKLDEFVLWARNTPDIRLVMEMMNKYPVQLEDAYLRSRAIQCVWEPMRPATNMHPFVVPVDITHSLEAAIKNARKEQTCPGPLTDIVKKQGIVLDLAATIDPKLWKFSGQYVGALTAFYATKAKVRAWIDDRKWLEQDWRKVESDVDLFRAEIGVVGLSELAVRERHQAMANEVISKFASCRMSSEFGTPSKKCFVSFENIVGGLCKGWLNDSPLDFCIETLTGVVENCYFLSSLLWSVGWPKIPTTSIMATKCIIHSVNLQGNHWGVIIARPHYDEDKDKLRVHVFMYEPLIDEQYREDVEMQWAGIFDNETKGLVKEGLRGFIERWAQASIPSTTVCIDPIAWVETPQQPDYSSCGVLVVAQAYAYATDNLQWQLNNVSKDDVQVMRLRMLWMILCKSKVRRMAGATRDKTKAIHDKLVQELK